MSEETKELTERHKVLNEVIEVINSIGRRYTQHADGMDMMRVKDAINAKIEAMRTVKRAIEKL